MHVVVHGYSRFDLIVCFDGYGEEKEEGRHEEEYIGTWNARQRSATKFE